VTRRWRRADFALGLFVEVALICLGMTYLAFLIYQVASR